MKLLIRALAFVMLLLATACNSEALTSEEAADIARWAGFTGMVSVDQDADSPNGLFVVAYIAPGIPLPIVHVAQPAGMPDAWAIIILMHELGHYVQWRDGYFSEMESVDREWQADVWGMRAACAYGVTLEDFHGLWAWMLQAYGDRESPSHGKISERMRHTLAHAGDACRPRVETPLR